MTSILITGFESFEGREVNQSWMLAKTLKEELVNERVEALQLPVVFGKSHQPILKWLGHDSTQVLIVSLGEAPVSKIQLECVGLNKRHTLRPDNQGQVLKNQSIEINGPLALETLWNLEHLGEKMKEMGFLLPLSFSAGTYLCNELLYRLLELEQSSLGRKIRTCFLHVPIEQHADEFSDNIRWLKSFINALKGEMDVPTRN